MSFEFQSTLINLTPEYRIAGEQIGGVRIFTTTDNIKVARVMITGDKDIQFAATGAPYETGVPNDIYVALQPNLAEILEDELLVNPSAISSIKYTATEIIIQIEGDGRPWRFVPTADPELLAAKVIADHTYELTAAGFTALSTAAATLRESVDGTLEGLSTAITTEIDARIVAITDEEQRVDALIASGMWLYPDQASFPAPGDNHGRVVHSHADGSMFYAHGGAWHKIENEAEAEAARAALSGRLDTLEADPTTAAALATGDAATLSSANTYTDTAVTNVIGTAPGVLDTLGEIADAINDDANVYTTLVAQIAAVQTDVDGNETDSDAAEAALSARITTLEADPTTATALAAVQTDVDANEAASDAAESALSGRLDTLEADATTATAVAAVQSDVDQNETDADAADAALSGRLDVLEADPTTATAVALKAPLAAPDFTGQVDIDTNARIEFADNLTKIHNVLRGTSINIGNNIELKPAAAGGRVEITGDLIIDASDFTNAADDTAAAAAGVVVGQVYRNGSQLMVRVS
jgi:hypothetical protein